MQILHSRRSRHTLTVCSGKAERYVLMQRATASVPRWLGLGQPLTFNLPHLKLQTSGPQRDRHSSPSREHLQVDWHHMSESRYLDKNSLVLRSNAFASHGSRRPSPRFCSFKSGFSEKAVVTWDVFLLFCRLIALPWPHVITRNIRGLPSGESLRMIKTERDQDELHVLYVCDVSRRYMTC